MFSFGKNRPSPPSRNTNRPRSRTCSIEQLESRQLLAVTGIPDIAVHPQAVQINDSPGLWALRLHKSATPTGSTNLSVCLTMPWPTALARPLPLSTPRTTRTSPAIWRRSTANSVCPRRLVSRKSTSTAEELPSPRQRLGHRDLAGCRVGSCHGARREHPLGRGRFRKSLRFAHRGGLRPSATGRFRSFDELGRPEFQQETQLDGYFTTPAQHGGVSFVVASGDTHSPASWPATSPNCLGVGGTTLTTLDASGSYRSEIGWAYSTGGPSQFETEPNYQSSVQNSGMCGTPTSPTTPTRTPAIGSATPMKRRASVTRPAGWPSAAQTPPRRNGPPSSPSPTKAAQPRASTRCWPLRPTSINCPPPTSTTSPAGSTAIRQSRATTWSPAAARHWPIA